jgi:DNA-binding PadR family transcriptional regulator
MKYKSLEIAIMSYLESTWMPANVLFDLVQDSTLDKINIASFYSEIDRLKKEKLIETSKMAHITFIQLTETGTKHRGTLIKQ